MLNIVYNPETKDLSSMRVLASPAKILVNIENDEELERFINSLKDKEIKNIFVIGDGTNTVFVNKNNNLILIKLNFQEIIISDNDVEVGAGVNWDDFVVKYIEMGGVGMEMLSKIPGTIGAAPVQNIGAYGEEVSNFINQVSVYDLADKKFKTLENCDCEFTYRNSIFKKQKNRFIILSVTFEIKRASLTPDPSPTERGEVQTVQEKREEIIKIRESKLPDPKIVYNCGSFFKNIFLDKEEVERVKKIFPEIPVFAQGEQFKIPTAYVLEKLGFKNYNENFWNGNFATYKNHALVIISNGEGDAKEFLEFINKIKKTVYDKTALIIEEEVNLI